MQYIEVSLPKSDLLPYLLGEIGYESFVEADDGLLAYIQEKDFSADRLIAKLREYSFDVLPEWKKAENKDWNEEWEKENTRPFEFKDLKILIEAKMAFGTGQHQTTRMMVEQLQSLSPLTGKRVLDAGCGTGILSIASAMLGAGDVWGYDIDEWSVENSRHNTSLNNVGCCQFRLGDASLLGGEIQGPFDIVMANIHLNILLNDLPRFLSVMGKASWLLVSGFYEQDAEKIIQAYESAGLTLENKNIADGGWCCLAFKVHTAEL